MSNNPSQKDKAQLRSELTTARVNRSVALTSEDRIEAAAHLATTALADPLVTAALAARGTVASYLPLDSEPDTTVLHSRLLQRGIRVVVPECVTDAAGEPTMAWIELEESNADVGTDFEVGPTSGSLADSASRTSHRDQRGMPIPDGRRVGIGPHALALEGCRLILVPALAATSDGHRLGKGAGYYDRLLGELPHSFDHSSCPTSVAIVFADELLDTVPTQAHDAPVSGVIAV